MNCPHLYVCLCCFVFIYLFVCLKFIVDRISFVFFFLQIMTVLTHMEKKMKTDDDQNSDENGKSPLEISPLPKLSAAIAFQQKHVCLDR